MDKIASYRVVKLARFRVGAMALTLGLCWAAQAEVVAWYRFEDATGTATQETIYTNSVDATKFPMYAGVCGYNGNDKYSKSTLAYTAGYMPYVTNAFTTVDLTNPLEGTCLPNNRSVALNVRYDAEGAFQDDRCNPHTELFIDDAVDLRLQTFTLEFFARAPQQTINWRCLVCRAGKKYADSNQGFKLYCNSLGYLSELTVTAVSGDPLCDKNGLVTNAVTYRASTGNPRIDDDKWHHYAIVVDGTAKTAAVYLDYVKKGSVTFAGDIYYEPDYPLCFGGNPNCSYFNFAASFDEIRISNEALTTKQMLGYARKRAEKYRTAVDERTILYYPFDGSTEGTTYGSEMASGAKACVPYLANQAIAGPFLDINATVATTSAATNAVNPQLTSDVPGTVARFGLQETNALANAQGIHLTTNGVPTCDYVNSLMIETCSYTEARTTLTDLFSDSCTFEVFYRAAYPAPFLLQDAAWTTVFGMYGGFAVVTKQNGDWNSRYLSVSFGGCSLTDPTKGVNETTIAGYLKDNKWHHLAFVYDKENGRADFYLDYMWKLGAEVPDFEAKWYNTGSRKGLVLGGCYWPGLEYSVCDFAFDEARVTRGALRPYEFLRTIPVEADAADQLARATFDETSAIGPYADAYAAATKSGTVAQTTVRARRVIKESRAGGEVINTNNVGALQFQNGTLTYAGHDILAAEDQFTVEMFLKATAAVADEGIARINRNVASGVTNAVTWALAFADDQGHIKVTVDTDAAEGQVVTFGGDSFTDGQWHHLGLLFAYDTADAANTRISLYRDGVLVGSEVVPGHILTRPYRMNFMLGAGAAGTTNFTGFIDELRISSKLLDPDYFMMVERKGFVLIVR